MKNFDLSIALWKIDLKAVFFFSTKHKKRFYKSYFIPQLGLTLDYNLLNYSLLDTTLHLAISLMSWVFTNGSGDQGSTLGSVIPKNPKMVLCAALINTQHYKVRIKGKAV